MWDDFCIGNQDAHCSASSIIDNLSANKTHFWWTSVIYPIGGRIEKATREGQSITSWISDTNIRGEDLDHLILSLAIPHIAPVQIIDLMERIRHEAERRGIAKAKDKIQEAIGL